MAMTLRLSPKIDAQLGELAQRSGMSKQKIITIAIEAHLERTGQSEQAQRVFDKVLTRDKELLERLANA
ncbi:MAG: ribbon-helix-helix protein, CopG family [Pontimonas sp.]|jgi:predicted transcriptional regulator|nr:ribbon-helix-helix protein, CopG family [Pontimonas sp.]